MLLLPGTKSPDGEATTSLTALLYVEYSGTCNRDRLESEYGRVHEGRFP